MRRTAPLLALTATALMLAACSSPPSLAEVMDTCELESASWMPDDDGIVVGTSGASPETEDQVQCILDETGASPELQKDIWVDTSAAGPQPYKVQDENGLRYSWSWTVLGQRGFTLIITPE